RVAAASGSPLASRVVVATLARRPGEKPGTVVPFLRYVFHVFDTTTGKLVFQTVQTTSTNVAFCGTNDRYLLVPDARSGARPWYAAATGKDGPSVAHQGLRVLSLRTPDDGRRVVVNFSPRSPIGPASVGQTIVHVVDAETAEDVVPPFVPGAD